MKFYISSIRCVARVKGERPMSILWLVNGPLLGAITLVAASVMTQAPAQEQSVSRSAEDGRLQWTPCPSFMPKGCELAVLHGDPAKPNADIFLRLPAKATIPEHWHTSAERMVLVSGELAVTYKGQERVVLRPGTYAYGPAKLPHTASCESGTPCVLFIAFESPVDAVPNGAGAK